MLSHFLCGMHTVDDRAKQSGKHILVCILLQNDYRNMQLSVNIFSVKQKIFAHLANCLGMLSLKFTTKR